MGKKGQAPIKVVRVVLCGGIMPKQSVEFSAGYDLYVPFDTVIKRGRQAVPIGIKVGVPKGIDGHIRPRSGFSIKGMEGYTIPRFKWLKPKKKRFDADVIQGTIDCGYMMRFTLSSTITTSRLSSRAAHELLR